MNANGGVNGRQITFTYLDDAYNPSQTVQATRQLVEQDKIFADYDSLGTEQNLAIRDYLAQRGVPQVFVATGARTFGADYKKYPGTIGFQPTYAAEGFMYGRYIRTTKPKAKIAVLYQNDDYGKELLAGLHGGLAPLGKAIVATQGFEPTATDVSSQISSLKGSGANDADDLRDADGHDPGVRLGEQARLEAADLRQRRLVGLAADEDLRRELEQRDRRGLALDRLPQGPDEPEVEERPGDEALPLDHGEVRHGRRRTTSSTSTRWRRPGRWSTRSSARARTSPAPAC